MLRENPVDAEIEQGDTPAVLARIDQPGIDLALWRRALPVETDSWLDRLPFRRLPHGRVLARLDEVPAALAALFTRSATPDTDAARLLAADMADLACLFAAAARTETIDLRLDTVRDDGCWRFHRDRVPLRLLSTYRGPGTQYVPAACSEEALRAQRAYCGPLHEMPRHAVALFRGDVSGGGRGVVHRSPPIAAARRKRLLLCLNLPSAASPPPWPELTDSIA
jgi:hypothetical protein